MTYKSLSDLSFAQQDFTSVNNSLDKMNTTASQLSKSLTTAFSSAQSSGKSFDQTLQSITTNLGKMVISNTASPIATLVQSGLSNLGSAVQSTVTAFANGGIVNQPQFFNTSSGQAGLMGERGAEAIIPLARGPDGQLGLKTDGQQNQPAINISIATPDASSFVRSQVQMSSMIARAVARGQRSF
jgi:phage-related minor tail protein